jgi:acyl-CoA thioesterase I
MMGSDMSGGRAVKKGWSRRQWLLHCSVLGAAARVHAAQADSSQRVILVVGDSLSAEYGLQRGSGWVALLEQRLARERIAARLVNASISGDTTSGGRSRLPALLREHRPTHVLIELGGNDALRGLPLDMTRDNLSAMARSAAGAGARVVVLGMQVPPNYGRKYSDDFAAMFDSVAKQERAALVPFLLKGVADGPRAEQLFQPDRIHPTEAAQPMMLDNVWPVLKPVLAK